MKVDLKLWFFAAFLGFSFFTIAEEKKYRCDWERDGLKGKVKTVELYFYPKENRSEAVKSEEFKMGPYIKKYNSVGNYIELSDYHKIDRVDRRVFYYYDLQNRLIRIKQTSPGSGLDYVDSITWENTTEYHSFYIVESGKLRKSYLSYDTLGNKMVEVQSNYMNEMYVSSTWQYDSLGNNVEHIFFSGRRFDHKFIWKYDFNHNVIEQNKYKSDSSLQHTTYYEYDSTNLLLKETMVDPQGNFNHSITYKYNDQRDLIEKSYSFHNPDWNRIERWEYTYDSVGNPLTEIESRDSVVVAIRVRKYTYY